MILRQFDERKTESILELKEEAEIKERCQDMDLKLKEDIDFIESNKQQAQDYCIKSLLIHRMKPEKVEFSTKPLIDFLSEVQQIVLEAQSELGTLQLDYRKKNFGVKRLEKNIQKYNLMVAEKLEQNTFERFIDKEKQVSRRLLQILADKEAELKKLKKKVKLLDNDDATLPKEVLADDMPVIEIDKLSNIPNKSTFRDYLKNNSNFSYNLTTEQASKMGAFYPRRPMTPTEF